MILTNQNTYKVANPSTACCYSTIKHGRFLGYLRKLVRSGGYRADAAYSATVRREVEVQSRCCHSIN